MGGAWSEDPSGGRAIGGLGPDRWAAEPWEETLLRAASLAAERDRFGRHPQRPWEPEQIAAEVWEATRRAAEKLAAELRDAASLADDALEAERLTAAANEAERLEADLWEAAEREAGLRADQLRTAGAEADQELDARRRGDEARGARLVEETRKLNGPGKPEPPWPTTWDTRRQFMGARVANRRAELVGGVARASIARWLKARWPRVLRGVARKAGARRAGAVQPAASKRETELLARIREGLPDDVARRLLELRAKLDQGELSEREELLRLNDQAEERDADRVKAIGELAVVRGDSAPALMRDLGLATSAHG